MSRRSAAAAAPSAAHRQRELAARLAATRTATARTLTGPVAALLLSAWLTAAAAALTSVFAPLILPVTALVRATGNANRRSSARRTGVPLHAAYRPLRGNALRRARVALCDPASWRDAAWLLWSALPGWVLAALTLSLFGGSIFYLIYPVLFALAPPPVFRDPFGPWSHLHSVAQSCAVMPVAVLCIVLWYVTTLPLARADDALARACLGSDAV